MKTKILITIFVSLIGLGHVFGQENPTQSTKVKSKEKTKVSILKAGIKAGLNASLFSNRIGEFGDGRSDLFDSNIRINFEFGAFVNYKFSKAAGLQSELLITGRGGSYRRENNSVVDLSGNDNQAYYVKNYGLQYVEIPILLNLYVSDYVTLSPGIAPGFNIGSKLRYNGFKPSGGSGPLVDVNESYETEPFDYANPFITNLIFDLNVNIPGTVFSIYGRYAYAMNNVYKVEKLDGYNMNTTMHTFSCGASLKF